MPRTSRKQKYLASLRRLLKARRVQRLILAVDRAVEHALGDDEPLEDDFDKMINDNIDACLLSAYKKAESSRYLFRRKKYRNRKTAEHFEKDLLWDLLDEVQYSNSPMPPPQGRTRLSNDEFLQKYRMTRSSFRRVVELIKDHEIFKSKFNKQAPVEYQLMTWLKFVGTERRGGLNLNQRETLGLANGTADLYRRRVNLALCSLAEQFYNWPDEEEREQISEEICDRYDLPNCVGIADGTLFPLAYKPKTLDAPKYWGRKFGYSLSTLIVCDHNHKIRYYLAGFPGSAHDNMIYQSSKLVKDPSAYFSDKQYILGDSAFEDNPHMVVAFLKDEDGNIPKSHEKFNKKLSDLRIISEDTISLLKGRFPWLRSICLRIQDGKDGEPTKSIRNILTQIKATVVLHNVLVSFGEDKNQAEWEDEDDYVSDLDDPEKAPYLPGDVFNIAIPENANKDKK